MVGDLDFVSHCYLRPRHPPEWPYNLFAMVHGRDRDEVRRKAEQIVSILGSHCRGHETLFSKRILKKTGLRIRQPSNALIRQLGLEDSTTDTGNRRGEMRCFESAAI